MISLSCIQGFRKAREESCVDAPPLVSCGYIYRGLGHETVSCDQYCGAAVGDRDSSVLGDRASPIC